MIHVQEESLTCSMSPTIDAESGRFHITWRASNCNMTGSIMQSNSHNTSATHYTWLEIQPRVASQRFWVPVSIVVQQFLSLSDVTFGNENEVRVVVDENGLGGTIPMPTVIDEATQTTRFCCSIHTAKQKMVDRRSIGGDQGIFFIWHCKRSDTVKGRWRKQGCCATGLHHSPHYFWFFDQFTHYSPVHCGQWAV